MRGGRGAIVACFGALLGLGGCQTAPPAEAPAAVYAAESLVLKRAPTDLSCEGRIHVTTAEGIRDRYLAQGCGREAAYVVTCGAGPQAACQDARRL